MTARILDFPVKPPDEPKGQQYLFTPVIGGIVRDDQATLVEVAEPGDELTDEPIPYVLTEAGWNYPLG